MWRPKNWKNPHLEVLTNSPTFTSKLYEAGADAMHKASIEHLERNLKSYRDSTVGQLLDSMFWQEFKGEANDSSS